MRPATALTARPPRRDRPHTIAHPHVARAREPPPRQPPTTVRARQTAGGQSGRQLLRTDRDQEHRESSVHTCRRKPSRPRRGRKGATRVGTPTRPPITPSDSIPATSGPISTINGTSTPMRPQIERRSTSCRRPESAAATARPCHGVDVQPQRSGLAPAESVRFLEQRRDFLDGMPRLPDAPAAGGACLGAATRCHTRRLSNWRYAVGTAGAVTARRATAADIPGRCGQTTS